MFAWPFFSTTTTQQTRTLESYLIQQWCPPLNYPCILQRKVTKLHSTPHLKQALRTTYSGTGHRLYMLSTSSPTKRMIHHSQPSQVIHAISTTTTTTYSTTFAFTHRREHGFAYLPFNTNRGDHPFMYQNATLQQANIQLYNKPCSLISAGCDISTGILHHHVHVTSSQHNTHIFSPPRWTALNTLPVQQDSSQCRNVSNNSFPHTPVHKSILPHNHRYNAYFSNILTVLVLETCAA